MKVICCLLFLGLLQSCQIDDYEERKNELQVKPVVQEGTVEVLAITENHKGIVEGVSAGDTINLKISGIRKTPLFGEVCEREVSCSWNKVIIIPRFDELYGMSSDFMISPLKEYGMCLVRVRDFLGYEEDAINFNEDLDEVRLRIAGNNEVLAIGELKHFEQDYAEYELQITEEELSERDNLEFFVEPESAELVRTGILEIIDNDFLKKNIKITGVLGFPVMISAASTQEFELKIFKQSKGSRH